MGSGAVRFSREPLAALQISERLALAQGRNPGLKFTRQGWGTSGSHLRRKVCIRHQLFGPIERGSAFLKHLQTSTVSELEVIN